MTDLKDMHCSALEGTAALPETGVGGYLERLVGWALLDGAIQKRFAFPDFHHTMAFVNAVAWIAHAEDHHPDLLVGYGHCTVRYRTHSVGGLSLNDFICAAQIDALFP